MSTIQDASSPGPVEPQQERSRRTQERILRATERLLQRRPFEEISVAQIVRAARTSTGAFYARFPSKEALLPALSARYDAGISKAVRPPLERIAEQNLPLDELTRTLVRAVIARFTDHRNLVRAVALYVRIEPGVLDPAGRERRKRLHERVAALFEPHYGEIAGPDPGERARLAMYFLSAVLRDKLIFGEAPHASATPLSAKRLEDEVTALALAYLRNP